MLTDRETLLPLIQRLGKVKLLIAMRLRLNVELNKEMLKGSVCLSSFDWNSPPEEILRRDSS